MRSPFVTLLVFALVCASSVLAGPIPPPKEGQGLLVLIRPGDPGGADMLADYVFDGETPLAVTKGGTYKAVDAAPGEHMIWCQGGGDVIDVVPGQRTTSSAASSTASRSSTRTRETISWRRRRTDRRSRRPARGSEEAAEEVLSADEEVVRQLPRAIPDPPPHRSAPRIRPEGPRSRDIHT